MPARPLIKCPRMHRGILILKLALFDQTRLGPGVPSGMIHPVIPDICPKRDREGHMRRSRKHRRDLLLKFRRHPLIGIQIKNPLMFGLGGRGIAVHPLVIHLALIDAGGVLTADLHRPVGREIINHDDLIRPAFHAGKAVIHIIFFILGNDHNRKRTCRH